MDRKLKKIVKTSLILVLILIIFIISIYFVYKKSSLSFYVGVIETSLFLVILIFVIFNLSVLMMIFSYKKKLIGKHVAKITFYSVNLTRPLLIFMANVFKINNDDFKNFFIELNNIIVNSYGVHFRAENILAIMPHCLQNFDCNIKITGDSSKCKRCGKCCLAEIITICEELKISLEIVTGGTAARNIVKKYRPKLIVAVACERDLLEGMIDVGIIPVFGVVNKRPNGPCFNTDVDIKLFKQSLNKIVKK